MARTIAAVARMTGKTRRRLRRRSRRLADTVDHLAGGTTTTAPQVFEGCEADRSAVEAARRELDDRAVALLEGGAAPDDTRVTALVADHHESVSRHRTPDAVSCTGLRRWYVEDPTSRGRFDARHPGLAVFWGDALAAWAAAHLA